MNVDWWGVESELLARGSAVHIGVSRGWSSSVARGEFITVGGTRAKALTVRQFASVAEIPASWVERFKGQLPDPVTASNYGLYGVMLVRA